MSLNELAQEVFANARNKGFADPDVPRPVSVHVALIHTEVSEIFEAHRDGLGPNEFWYEDPTSLNGRSQQAQFEWRKPIGIPSEVADVFIRLLDFCADHDIDLDRAVREKMDYNTTRPQLNGGRKL